MNKPSGVDVTRKEEAKEEKKEEKKGVAAPVRPRRAVKALSPFEDMDRLFEHMLRGAGPWWGHPLRTGWPWAGEAERQLDYRVPRVDVVERDDAVVVRAELPGVDKKDLDVTMTEGTLTIKAATRKETKEDRGDYHRSEIVQGEFRRTVPLPVEVDADKAQASFKDGLLELTLPKAQVARRRNIKVE